MTRVLLVDDEQQVRQVLSAGLTKVGYDVVEASNGMEALARFKEEPIDAVVMDIIMPDKEGIETIIELRQSSKELPILAISGGGRMGKMHFLEVSRTFGADSTMEKPFTVAELAAELNSLIQRK